MHRSSGRLSSVFFGVEDGDLGLNFSLSPMILSTNRNWGSYVFLAGRMTFCPLVSKLLGVTVSTSVGFDVVYQHLHTCIRLWSVVRPVKVTNFIENLSAWSQWNQVWSIRVFTIHNTFTLISNYCRLYIVLPIFMFSLRCTRVTNDPFMLIIPAFSSPVPDARDLLVNTSE